jgi:hypothetical protein
MESQRTSFALGPFEISFKRREDGARFGWLGSLATHLIIIALLMTSGRQHRPPPVAEAVPQIKPDIPVTFVDPLRPPPQPKPPAEPVVKKTPPPPAAAKPLRMESVPEVAMSAPRPSAEALHPDAGRNDRQPAGGEQGGPRPTPTPGNPQPVEGGAAKTDQPKDILGRLREFKEAVEAPRPSTPKGPAGGGQGRGGITMPNLPATGFGVGNLEFEGRDYDWENYGRQIHGIIWRAWHNRLLITASVFERWASENRSWLLDHQNAVRFTILKTGQVVDVAIETPSGCYPLDDSATDALKEVVLPPLPPDFQRDAETVHARFIAQGEIRVMKSFLQQMKNAGYF